VRIAGVVALMLGAACATVVVLAAVGTVAGSIGGYVCLSLCAVGFGAAGVALLAGSRVVPAGWPPRPATTDSTEDTLPTDTDTDTKPSGDGRSGEEPSSDKASGGKPWDEVDTDDDTDPDDGSGPAPAGR